VKFEVKHNGKVVISKDLAEGSFKIGRAPDCDLVLESTKVSKHHALLVIKGNRAAILDTGSSNGTFVNGILVKKQLLQLTDVIEIGDYKLQTPAEIKPKRNLEVFSSQGSAALEADMGSEPDSQEEINAASIPDGGDSTKKNPGEVFINFVDKKLLLPFYEIVRITDYRFLIAIILTSAISVASFFSVTPILSWGNDITKQESLKRGHTILKQVVRENYRILSKANDTSILTVAAAEADKDMLDAYILDTKTKSVLAPTKYLSKSINDPHVLLAIEDLLEKGMTESTHDRGDGTFVLAQSIPYYGTNEGNPNSELEGSEVKVPAALVIGYFKIPKNIVGVYEPLAISGLISLLLALASYFFLFKMISHPVGQLSEQLDAALKGDDVQLTCEAKFPELETLATVMNFSLSRLKSSGGGMAAAPSGVAGGADFEAEEGQYLRSAEEFCFGSTDGILILDREKRVKLIGPVLADLLSLRPQYAIGQNIGDASRDGSFAGTVIEMCERVVSSLGENQSATLEINGVSRNLAAVGHRLSDGEIGFIVITVKMNG
jgi:pSer/pThr/pTyr-binding forkhead associated (FHA) protein